jgi:hypothetical protein
MRPSTALRTNLEEEKMKRGHMTETRKPLDLDELFGQAQAIKVKWQGKEYGLMSINAISPKQAVKMSKMQTRVIEIQQANPDEDNDEMAVELERMFDEMLTMLNGEFPLATMPFAAKMRIVEYYTEQSEGKKATAPTPPTGAKRSRS